jgi:hypothetical protein
MLDNNIYYTTRGIYGVKIYTYINKECNILFEQKLNTLMSNEIIEEVKVFYSNLDENSKTNVKIKIYRKCNSIENKETCMIWCDISLNKFIKEIGI